jgi:hypothetical protein
MATYVPNAFEVTQPTEDKSVESAALEFRTAKAAFTRSLRFQATDTGTGELPLAATRATKLLAFDASGVPVIGPSATDVAELLTLTEDILAAGPAIEQAVITTTANALAAANSQAAAALSEAEAEAAEAVAIASKDQAANSAGQALAHKNAAESAASLANNSAISAQASKVAAADSATASYASKLASESAASDAQIAAGNASLIIVAGLGFTDSTAYDYGNVSDTLVLFPTDYGTL